MIFYQTNPGSFVSEENRIDRTFVLGDLGVMNGPVSVAAEDLDGDGDLDLVSANQFGDTMTIFLGGH